MQADNASFHLFSACSSFLLLCCLRMIHYPRYQHVHTPMVRDVGWKLHPAGDSGQLWDSGGATNVQWSLHVSLLGPLLGRTGFNGVGTRSCVLIRKVVTILCYTKRGVIVEDCYIHVHVPVYIHVNVHELPVQCQIDLCPAETHVHHVMDVGGRGIAGKVSVQKVLLKVVEVEPLGREGVRPRDLVLGGRGGNSGLDLLRRQLGPSANCLPVPIAVHVYRIYIYTAIKCTLGSLVGIDGVLAWYSICIYMYTVGCKM